MVRRDAAGAVLITLCSAQFLEGLDVSSMGPALPQIQDELGMGASRLQWVLSAYVLGYGGFLLLGGRIVDVFRRRDVLLISLAVFAAASLVGGIATDGTALIAARFVKGVAAAFTAPAALAILLATYTEEDERHRALGVFASVTAAGFVFGLFFGGLLSNLTWRLTLLMPAAACALVGLAVVAFVHRDPGYRQEPRRIDVAGAVLVTAGLMTLVYAASEAASRGWGDLRVATLLVASAVVIGGFILVERRSSAPLVPLAIFRRSNITRSNVVALALQGAYASFQFIATLYYQNTLGWSPFEAGLAFLPGGVTVALLAPRFAHAVRRLGVHRLMIGGLALQAVSYAWFLALDDVSSVLLVVVQQVLGGFGYAATYPAANIGAVASADEREEGLVSGLFIASIQIGSGLFVAVAATHLGSAATTSLADYRSALWVPILIAAAGALVALPRPRRLARRYP